MLSSEGEGRWPLWGICRSTKAFLHSFMRIIAAFMKYNFDWFVASLIGWVFLELCEHFKWSWRRQPSPLICPSSWSTKERWFSVFSRKTRSSGNERRNASGSIFHKQTFYFFLLQKYLAILSTSKKKSLPHWRWLK